MMTTANNTGTIYRNSREIRSKSPRIVAATRIAMIPPPIAR